MIDPGPAEADGLGPLARKDHSGRHQAPSGIVGSFGSSQADLNEQFGNSI